MKFEISNRYPDLEGEVRLTIDTSRVEATEVLQAALDLRAAKAEEWLEAVLKGVR